MDQYLCNFLVPGFPKSGTSSLHEYLDQHPAICMSRPKECHYFARSEQWSKGVEFHNSLFSHRDGNEEWYGESSTIHCVWDEAIERIQRCLKNPKVILLMRHPVERLISQYRWLYAYGQESRSFLRAIEKDGESFHPDKPIEGNYKGYLIFSRYATYVRKWELAIGKENVLLLRSEGLGTSPEHELSKVWAFLGLEAISTLTQHNANATSDLRPRGTHPVHRVLRKLTPEVVKKVAFRLPGIKKSWKIVKPSPFAIVPPTVTDEERKCVAQMLKEHICFYNRVFHGDELSSKNA